MLLKNLFDSHCHLSATGQVACEIDLSAVASVADLANLRLRPEYRRGKWWVGFGWDESQWPERRAPNRHDLDRLCPEDPVYFSRCDGHAGVTNTAGLRALELWDAEGDPFGGQILRGEDGRPDGRLKESAHYRALEKLPAPTSTDRRRYLVEAVRQFNRAGFTHVRDMGATLAQWDAAVDLESQGEFSLHVDWNFSAENRADVERALSEAIEAKSRETRCQKVAGLKIYFDGSLGSDTAFLSRPYAHRSDGFRGLTCWSDEDAEAALRRVWAAGFPMAVHTIGDAAADRVVDVARSVSASGLGGRLHLEHVEILRPETIQKMKGLHVTCHLQPCHWHGDRRWLTKKLGSLAAHAFPWEALRRAKIPFYFGSDSPIESPSLPENLRALIESANEGIPALKADPLEFHRHPDPNTIPGETHFEDGQVIETRFDGRVVFSASGSESPSHSRQ